MQRAKLIKHIIVHIGLRYAHIPSSKAHQVSIARVRAYHDALLPGRQHGAVHHRRVARVEAAGNVCAGYEIKHFLIAAYPVRAEALAKIRIKVYLVHTKHLVLIYF